MLPAAHRMRSAADFSATTRHGSRATRGCVVVYVHSSDDAAPACAGLIVGRVVGNSVQRHRVARRIRGALAPLITELPDGTRVVVRALAGADREPELGRLVAAGLAAARSGPDTRQRRPVVGS